MTRADASSHDQMSSKFGIMLSGVLVALLLARVAALAFSQTDLFFDEAQYWSWSLEPAFGYFSKPPLIAWIIAAMTGLCGDGEFCIRLASPILYTLAAIAIFLCGKALYDERIGFWSAVVFATLPGISFSAGLASTDVPLLCLWSLALFALIKLLEARSWSWALLLGVTLGLGLLAKYAMIYFVGCALVFMIASPQARWLMRDPKGLAVILLAGLILLPNVLWNIDNGWITFGHTADNAKWGGELIKPLKMLEFLGSQFGVFGPILMIALVVAAVRAYRTGAGEQERLLLSFSLPIIVLIATQALLSRAHANWAATAYPAATVLVTAFLLKQDYRRIFSASLALHLVILLIISAAGPLASKIALPGRLDPFSRVLGWQDTAALVDKEVRGNGIRTVLTEDRLVTAEMLYYLKDAEIPVRSWRSGDRPRDHFEFTRPFDAAAPEPVLLVSLRPNTRYVSDHFAQSRPLTSRQIAAGPKSARTVYLTVLSGFKGR